MNPARRIRRYMAAKARQGNESALDTATKWQAALARADDIAYVELLESENARLERESRELKEQIQPQLAALPELYAERLNAIDLERKLAAVEAVRPDIDQLPEDLLAVLHLIQKLYPDRIIFSAAALESARVAKLNGWAGGVGVAWRLLRAMALTLHDLYIVGTADLARCFQDKSGFELALGEGSMTRRDGELMKSRLLEHDGTLLDVGAHAKYGNREPRLLRVHYGFCMRCVRIVVGHCGDHLTTAGTRRLR
jgi:hypothetical protein